MKRIAIAVGVLSLLGGVVAVGTRPAPAPAVVHHRWSRLPVWHPDYLTAQAVPVYGDDPEADELRDVQCPIPMRDRVKNYTGVQCVFSSLECLGRWADCKALVDPPLTGRADCKSFSGPADAAAKLKNLGVRFEMSYRDKAAGIALIKRAMADGRGTLWGIPGHAMVLCHYDEAGKVVKYINNSNGKLPVQTMTLAEFNQRWDTWVMVVYADPDPFPAKARGPGALDLPRLIPIVDRNTPPTQHPADYIPVPRRP